MSVVWFWFWDTLILFAADAGTAADECWFCWCHWWLLMLLMSDLWSNFCCLLSDSDSEVAADPVATTCTGELRSVKKVTAWSQESFSPGKLWTAGSWIKVNQSSWIKCAPRICWGRFRSSENCTTRTRRGSCSHLCQKLNHSSRLDPRRLLAGKLHRTQRNQCFVCEGARLVAGL